MRTLVLTAFLAVMVSATGALAQSGCGGNFSSFVDGLRAEAVQRGVPRSTVDTFFRNVRQDEAVIRADRRQGIFQRPFLEFSRALISQNRMDSGRRNLDRYRSLFDVARQHYGVSPGILLAFWAFETDFGAVQGDFNTVNALVTLAHDCRRPELFRPQVFAALELHARGALDPASQRGAWAGEIGMVQKLPSDILNYGVDADGSGSVDLARSVPDAILSAANMLRAKGWRAGEPWMHEVVIPQGLDLTRTGLRTELSVSDWQRMGVSARHGSLPSGNMRASVILPQGHRGPAFMVFHNFRTLFEWNQSFIYITTVAYFATRLEGAPVYAAGNPEPGLNQDQMRDLQRRLQGRGFNVGGVDGILGANTRAAVQDVQAQLGLPADGWPTPELLRRL
ncbi:lytic murein transglycosylase [Rhodobacteraceae bacterium 2376]|uniref:Lytic murein transglycosylase n=1 Tax=Rhabdonatronobacter sediminivivens TaxID=2743469 RepID=A0A7Z0I037_9RHOB|nr:lytic murein transglycosylase [Rhabdonatronobacter sediminivivens]NYS25467.1 lytic murein transglycosylase [Rhabdonatronobacter sediminivivens]